MRGRLYNARGIVLRRTPLGEADRIIRVLTWEYGKLSAVAKGARRPTSKSGGATEPMTRLSAQFAVGRNLDVMTQVQVEDSRFAVRKDLVRLACASYFLELIDATVEERQPVPDLCDLLDSALEELGAAAELQTLIHAFELQALGQLGFEPLLYECAICGLALEEGGPRFHPARGGLLCADCVTAGHGGLAVSPATVRAMRGLSKITLAEAAQTRLLPDSYPELARCLPEFVRRSVDAPLRSLQFLGHVMPAQPAGSGVEA